MNQRKDARIYARKARSAVQGKNLSKAVVFYSRAIQLNKNKSKYYVRMAETFVDQEKYMKACLLFQRVVMMKPNDARAYYNFGWTLDMLGKVDESIEMFKEAIRLNPNDTDAHESLAIVLSTKENYEEAHKHYMKALELKPSAAFKIVNGIGWIYFLQGMFAKAIEEFQKSISLNKKYTFAFWNMSLVLFCENKSEEALKFFEDGMKTLEEEENKVKTMKAWFVSFTANKLFFEMKLNKNKQILNEEQFKVLRMTIDGLAKMINLLTQYLEKLKEFV